MHIFTLGTGARGQTEPMHRLQTFYPPVTRETRGLTAEPNQPATH
jgi:hypothetical protein